MRYQSVKTTMKWVKGHDGVQRNEGSDALAKQGANKQTPDTLNLEIPPEFDVQGVKLPTLTQVTAYKGILERRESEQYKTTEKNMKLTRTAIKRITGEAETDATIWLNTQKKVIRPIIQQFIYKTMHGTHLVRKYWRNIDGYEEQETCSTCNETESMHHIMVQCRENSTHLIWKLVKDFWPHRNIPWPNIDLGTILRCGCINMQLESPRRQNQHQRKTRITHWGLT